MPIRIETHGYTCFTVDKRERWCTIFHDTMEEAALCLHERFSRDERADGNVVAAAELVDIEGRVVVIVGAPGSQEARDVWKHLEPYLGDDKHERLVAEVDPERHVLLAENAERMAHPTRPWRVESRHRRALELLAETRARLAAQKPRQGNVRGRSPTAAAETTR